MSDGLIDVKSHKSKPMREIPVSFDHKSVSSHEQTWIMRVLNDNVRGWPAVFGTRFVQVLPRHPRAIHISFLSDAEIASDPKTSFLRGLSYTELATDASPARIVLNRDNWDTIPLDSYFTSLESYRTYVVNHEMGHAAFRLSHRNYPLTGCRHASIMGQQTRQRIWDPRRIARPNSFPAHSPEALGIVPWEASD